jgi:hypothetical protein
MLLPLSRLQVRLAGCIRLAFCMQSKTRNQQGGFSILTRVFAFFGGSYFSLLLLALELTTIALSIAIFVVYGVSPTPSPKPFSTDNWVWVSPANSSHVAFTVRLFGGSDSLFICQSPPTGSSPCSQSRALQSIFIPVAPDGSGLFKTVVGGLSPGTRYYYQVCVVATRLFLLILILMFQFAGRLRAFRFIFNFPDCENKFQICSRFMRFVKSESSCISINRGGRELILFALGRPSLSGHKIQSSKLVSRRWAATHSSQGATLTSL